jgi:hypothetical protein
MATVNEFKERLKAIEERRGKLLPRPNLETYEEPEVAPSDPSRREPNRVYKTPKGNFRWDAVNGWVTP